MTLFKQIAILVSLVMLLLSAIIMVNDFSRSAKFLQGQLQTTAQDMATTLGIAITNLPDGQEPATLEVLFNSVFDSGYYSSIELVSTQGEVIHQKSQKITMESVPEWFLKMVVLEPSQGTTQVMKGWSQLGQLNVSLHPGFVYSGLYDSFVSTVKWLAVISFVAIALLWMLLHYLLTPLQRVKEQADSIHNNQFVIQQKLPATVELKRVVEAMNRMVSKVQGVFSEQEKTLSRYQEMLYQDKISGLGNRRYMLDHIQQSLAEESSFHGCMGVIKILHFEQLREQHGFEVTDQLLKYLASQIQQGHATVSADKTARLSDDELAFLCAADEESVSAFIQEVYALYQQEPLLKECLEDVPLVAGISALESGQKMGDVLSAIDYSLTQASSEGYYSIKYNVSNSLMLPQGKMQWRQWLDQVLEKEQLFLVGQKALNQQQQIVQQEVFIRARNEQNQVIPASSFMPMASSLGMAIEIDRAVFRLINKNQKLSRDIPLAVNLSASFFELADARSEFENMLKQCSLRGLRLCIEASHYILQQHADMCIEVASQVRDQGHQFGMDNLDLGQSLQLLQSARLNYVKINALTLCDLDSDEANSGFQALKTMTDTLDIQIIAVGVDSQEIFERLLELGVSIMQGNLLGEPEEV